MAICRLVAVLVEEARTQTSHQLAAGLMRPEMAKTTGGLGGHSNLKGLLHSLECTTPLVVLTLSWSVAQQA